MVLKFLINLVLLVVIVWLLLVLYNGIQTGQLQFGLNNLNFSHVNLTYPGISPPNNYIPQNQTIANALALINGDRNAYGLSNVSYSNESSAQQHSQSMLTNNYFSHWDIYDMKPYMRYTLLGGRGAVTENVAYIFDSAGVNVTKSLANMEYNMMYNDLQCCNNGHRDNILDPTHTQVSLGVAYNRTVIYFTEDFIDNYISWFYGTPLMTNSNLVQLKGTVPSGYYLSTIEVSYDPPLQNQTQAQLKKTSDYGYGQTIAGVGYALNGRTYYYPNMMTINASRYVVSGNNFDAEFYLTNALNKYGPGEYTVMVWLANQPGVTQNSCTTNSSGIQNCNEFIASTYTIFINSTMQQYIPTTV